MNKLLSSFALMATFMPFNALAQEGHAQSWQLGLQEAASPMMREITDFHHLLLIIITVITLAVTALLAFAVVKFRRRKNVEPATFAHNTMIEVLWTIVPVIILIIIAIPSFKLLYFEDRAPDFDLSVKVTGYQWYWGYEYMDYDGLEFLSYMITDENINEEAGQRRLLSTDEPVVLPVDTNVQILVTAADVLHSFAMPALGVKRDAVPGQLNETWVRIDKPGTYYGQCSEICGTGHAYMPIEIKAVSREEFDAWVASKGGTLKTTEEDSAEADEVTAAETEEQEQQDQPIENSDTEEADTVENKLDNPQVDEDNVSNPGQ